MLVLRRGTISVLTLTLALAFACVAGVARADDGSVKAAIKAQSHTLKPSPQLKRLLKERKLTASQTLEVIRLCRALEGKLYHAAKVVLRTPASTSTGRAGRNDWVKGVRGLGHGFAQLVTALQDVEHGNKAAGQTEAATALKTIAAANALDVKADHELRLPVGA